MAHRDEHIICPNCGYQTSENYCARCGQETHLHNDTFGGLIMHFAGHYFHYDSKFWQTMKVLWFSPGKLTLAYWNKQRMRYIPPISLYIFVSAVFFLIFFIIPKNKATHAVVYDSHTDSAKASQITFTYGSKSWTKSIGDSVKKKEFTGVSKDKKIDPKEVEERALHLLPKVFFFMIPLMGFVLFLMFYRRKELTYVNHIIFALHYHSFWFSVMLLEVLYQYDAGAAVVNFIFYLLSALYFVVALRNVYKISWARSVSYSAIVAICYLIFFITTEIFVLSFITKA
jgi:hypothetical protein